MHLNKQLSRRRKVGQMGPLFIILTIILGIIIGSLAIEFSHMSTIRTALHNATDAAALAGAQDLWFAKEKCANNAYTVAALNFADGKSISNASPGVNVKVTVTEPQGSTPGNVKVEASMVVNHLFSPFYEHWTDTISVSSVAGTAGKLWRLSAGQAFPLAVSIDQIPLDHKGNPLGLPLNQLKPGDSITLYIGSQSFKNATFTSLSTDSINASILNRMIDEILGQAPKKPIDIPSLAIGDTISLSNGVNGQKDLSKDPTKSQIYAVPFFILPIVQGQPPYNRGAKVVGFTGIKVTDIKSNPASGITLSITGTLTNLPQVNGESGPIPTSGEPTSDQAISRLELGPIQLIK